MNRFLSKTIIFTSFMMLSVTSLVGCGNNTSTNSALKTNGSATSEVKGTLHFYTSQPDTDASVLVEAFNKKYPNVKVDLFRSGTEEVMSRLLAEAKTKNVQADVLLVADAPTFVGLKKKNLLLPYKSPEAGQIPNELKDSDGTYYGTKVMATAMVVNSTNVKNAPDSWQVMIEPAASGKIIMPSPLYSGAAAYNLGVFTRQADFDWEFFKKLKDNKVTVEKGNGAVLKKVSSGEKDYGMIVDFMVARAIKEGSPVKLVYPKEGVPVNG